MLNLAVIGFGWWGQHIAARLASSDVVRPVVVAEVDPERRALAAGRGLDVVASFEEAIARADVDAVALTSPNSLHESQTIAAAKAGKHVFCEKPFALSGASAKRAVAACREAGVTVGVGHERRYEPALVRVKAMIDAGELGTIMHAEANFSHDKLIHVPSGDWRTKKATAPAGAMTAMGIHLSDMMIWMFGRVDRVAAFTAHRALDWETGDLVTAQLKFEAGMTATFSAILYTPHFIRLQVFGTRKWVEVINSTHPDTPGGIVDLLIHETGKEPIRETFEWTDSVKANLEAIAEAAAGASAYPISDDDIVHNIELLEAISRASEDLCVVKLSP
jgi:predicted dehydrogenase